VGQGPGPAGHGVDRRTVVLPSPGQVAAPRRDGPRTVGDVDRLVLVTSSPRLPAGVLSWPAWEALRSGPVHTADPEGPQARAVRATGVPVRGLDAVDDAGLAVAFRGAARGGVAVWLCGPDGDPGFAGALAELVAREPAGADLQVVAGSTDPPGARLLDVVAVMDRLRSPGGCPWDAEQTHRSLAPYLLEESYELLEAIEEDDPTLLREELGDVLLQVVFHARLVEERPDGERWGIDDVAGDLVAKLVRRHPHVFADRQVTGVAEVSANWDEIKAEEKRRESVTDGVPLGQPALALAAKLHRRAGKAGVTVPVPAGDELGARLFALVEDAVAAGLDPEAALRATARAYRDAVRVAEGLPAAAG
jgi:XTP/dITP diphosphohydrolase